VTREVYRVAISTLRRRLADPRTKLVGLEADVMAVIESLEACQALDERQRVLATEVAEFFAANPTLPRRAELHPATCGCQVCCLGRMVKYKASEP
jgi:hypothetical protein